MHLARFLPRFKKAYDSLPVLASREQWSRSTITAFQLDELNRLWSHAVCHVPFYRRLAADLDLPPHFTSLDEFRSRVPLLSKAPVRANKRDFLSEQAKPGAWYFTGGSTATPTPVFRSHEAHQAMLRSRYRFHQMWDVDIFDPWVFLWGHRLSYPPGLAGWKARLTTQLNDKLRNRIRLSAYHLGKADLRRYLDRIAAFQPAVIYAYSMAGYLLALEAEETGFRCPSLKMVNLTSEPATPQMVQTVERCFGVPAVVEYGSIECGFIAGEWPDRTLRVREDTVLLETLPRDDGRFDLVVTPFANTSFPLIRYAIGDTSEHPLSVPGTGFAILRNVEGRNEDLITTRTGRKLHGIICEEIIEWHPGIRRYRVHQHDTGRLSVLLEHQAPLAEDVLHAIRDDFYKLTEGFEVDVRAVDELPPTPAGKYRPIVSDLTRLRGGTSNQPNQPQTVSV